MTEINKWEKIATEDNTPPPNTEKCTGASATEIYGNITKQRERMAYSMWPVFLKNLMLTKIKLELYLLPKINSICIRVERKFKKKAQKGKYM